MNYSDLHYKIALSMLPKVGDKIGKQLVEYCGSAEAVFNERKNILQKIPDIGNIIAGNISNKNVHLKAEEELKFIEKHHISTYFYFDANYPYRLRNCVDSPLLLYYKGNANLNAKKVLSIVGTRKATEYGKEITNSLLADLASSETLIISGLAYGIDTCAHQSALDNHLATVGVLAHGLNTIYPLQNKKLAEKMISQGGLLTEFYSGTKLDPGLFPRRNRIVAGMCDAVVVVEAAISGGALITAEIANTYNKDVFAIPGKLTDKKSEGCNHLIKTNKASLLQSSKDLEYILGWNNNISSNKNNNNVQKSLFVNLSNDEQIIVDYLETKNDYTGIDDLCCNIHLPLSKLTSALISLEIQSIVKSAPGKRYKIN